VALWHYDNYYILSDQVLNIWVYISNVLHDQSVITPRLLQMLCTCSTLHASSLYHTTVIASYCCVASVLHHGVHSCICSATFITSLILS